MSAKWVLGAKAGVTDADIMLTKNPNWCGPHVPSAPTYGHPGYQLSRIPPIMLTNVTSFAFSSSARTIEPATVELRVEVMFIIFFASLFAVAFPTLSHQMPILRIPPVVFFIGKHFGTGVILSTAFIHLLDDAFRSLQNSLVNARYGNIGKWTGLIILGSLLVIFLVEYISTSYVDYLQSNPSVPSTPIGSVQPSRPASLSRPILYDNFSRLSISRQPNTESAHLTETTPLLPSTQPITNTSPRQPRRQVSEPHLCILSQSRDHSPHHHHHHHHLHTPITSAAVAGVPIDILTNSPRIFRQLGLGHSHSHGHVGTEQTRAEESVSDHIHHHNHVHERVSRRKQVVGILVLQLGIMIHSLVIGLTLAVTEGSDFTSLTTAILFHQLFEGLSLGIRIASVPPKHIESHTIVEDGERVFPSAPLPSLLLPTRCVPSNFDSDSPNSASPLDNSQAGKEVQPRKNYFWTFRHREVRWLKPTLSFLFAVTTPLGMGAGLMLWNESDGSDTTQMLLIQGTMSAISAGMLIYAGTVEMIAGDFVFGDVDGGHGHGHGHVYPHPHQRSGGPHSHFDNQPHTDGNQDKEEPSKTNATMTKKVLAVLSLFAGAACMGLIGLGE